MRAIRLVCAFLVVGWLACSAAFAQTSQDAQDLRQQIDSLRKDFEAIKQQYGDRLAALETKLAAAQGSTTEAPARAAQPAQAAVPPPQATTLPQTVSPSPASPQQTAQVPPGAEGGGGPTGQLPVYGAGMAGSKVFNPDIAVIGDFLGAAGRNKVQPDPFGPGSTPRVLQMHE